MRKLPYNVNKLEAYQNSGYCSPELKDKPIKELHSIIEADANLRTSYNHFCYMRWYSEYMRRVKLTKSGTAAPTIQDRINIKRQVEAMRDVKKEISNIRDKQKMPPLKIELFGDVIDEEDWTPLELALRQQYLKELTALQKSGGCSGCKKKALQSKYIFKLKELME